MRRLASVAICLALAACAQGPLESDWQQAQQAKNWHEEQLALPPYPKQGSNLVRFDAGTDTGFRFFVDTATLSVGADGVVRYVLIARSPQGAENVSFEGLRCRNDDYKVYATGGQDRHWVEAPGA